MKMPFSPRLTKRPSEFHVRSPERWWHRACAVADVDAVAAAGGVVVRSGIRRRHRRRCHHHRHRRARHRGHGPAAWQGAIMGDLDAAILLRRNYDVAPTELDIASINGLVASISSLIASKRYRRN
jgi:hypothetical protein